MKAVTIENKWFTTMISQMYACHKTYKNVLYKFKPEETEELIPLYGNSTYPVINFNNVTYNVDHYFKKQTDDYYSFNSKYFETNITRYEKNIMEKLILISLKDVNDSIMLSQNILDDETTFRDIFDSVTDYKFLQYNIR